MKLFLYKMFVIQFLHSNSLQKKHIQLYRYGYHFRLIIIHNNSIQVMILSAMDSIEGKS